MGVDRGGSSPSKLDYDTLQIEEVNFLSPRFDGNHMFVLPPVGVPSFHTKAKSMDGMDKPYDGHVWTKILTTNITNNLGLSFRSSTCVGHLQCYNPHCDNLQRVHRASSVNDAEFDGFTKDPFPVGDPVPGSSTMVSRICKEPPKCIAPCVARIFYVHSNDTTQRACIHLGKHRHPVKVGNCRVSVATLASPLNNLANLQF